MSTKILSRNGFEIQLGDKVEHFARQDYHTLKILPEYVGIVVDIDATKLPLIGVDTGGEFIRYIPHCDLNLL